MPVSLPIIDQLLNDLWRLPTQRGTQAAALHARHIVDLDHITRAAENMLLGDKQRLRVEKLLFTLWGAYIRESRVVIAAQGFQVAAVPWLPIQAAVDTAALQRRPHHLSEHATLRQGLTGKGRIAIAGNQAQVGGLSTEAQARQQVDQQALQHRADIQELWI